MDHALLHVDPKTNPQCIVGGNIQNTLTLNQGRACNLACSLTS